MLPLLLGKTKEKKKQQKQQIKYPEITILIIYPTQ